MNYCPKCSVSVKGHWASCPLCQTSLTAKEVSGVEQTTSFLNLSLRFSRKKIIQAFIGFSFLVIFIYFIAQYIWYFQFFGLEYILFGLMITWMMTVILIRKRRNIVKGIVYVLILFSLLGLYFDFINGWTGWSVTFVIPILSISALLAMYISIRFISLKAEDYVLYLELAAIVGIIPLLFLIMGWTAHPLPSIISVLFSFIMFVAVFITHRRKIRIELKKRMHI